MFVNEELPLTNIEGDKSPPPQSAVIFDKYSSADIWKRDRSEVGVSNFKILFENDIIPTDFSGDIIVDVSANTGTYIIGFCQQLDKSLPVLKSGSDARALVYPFDLSYLNDLSESTELGRQAAQNIDTCRQQLSHVDLKSPQKLDAFHLDTTKIDNRNAAVVLDIAGVVWHICEETQGHNDTFEEAMNSILKVYLEVLSDEGIVVLDDDIVESTGNKLRRKLGLEVIGPATQKESLVDQKLVDFFNERGFSLTRVADNSSQITGDCGQNGMLILKKS